jgi:uncharacterized protein YbjT (DUF2867 family)
MILVIGGTGQVGSELLRELGTARAPFRALVRSAGRAEIVRKAGGEAVVGDLADASALRTGLEGARKVFLLTPPSPDIPVAEGRIVDLAREAGVEHIVKLSAVGANALKPYFFARLHRESERRIESSGVPYTFLRPNFFMQNYLQFADTIRSQRAICAPAGGGRHADVDVRDVAAVAARVLTEDDHAGRIYELTGPEAQSFADAARKISKATGRDVAFVDVAPEEARKAMTSAGTPEWLADALIEIHAWFLRGEGTTNGSAVTLAVEEVLDRPPRSFEQFVRENVQAFGG